MALHKLSESKVRSSSIPEGKKEVMLNDGGGLYLRLSKSLSSTKQPNRYWIYRYTDPILKKTKKIGLGVYPDVSLAAARELSAKARQDPRALKSPAVENVPTLLMAATSWFEDKRKKVSDDYANDIWRSLELHILPQLGEVRLDQLGPKQVQNALRALEAKGNYETIRRLCTRLREIGDYFEILETIDTNRLRLTHQLFRAPDPSRRLPAISVSEIPDLLAAIYRAKCDLITLAQTEFALHVGLRPKECAQARWEEFDLQSKCWTVPGHRMKRSGRASLGYTNDHKAPLSPQVLQLLKTLEGISGHREHVFPNRNDPRKPLSSQTVNSFLKRIGYRGRLVAHGFRTLMSTYLNEQGESADVIEAALAHTPDNKVRAAYNRTTYYDSRIQLMQKWSNHLDNCAKKAGVRLIATNSDS